MQNALEMAQWCEHKRVLYLHTQLSKMKHLLTFIHINFSYTTKNWALFPVFLYPVLFIY